MTIAKPSTIPAQTLAFALAFVLIGAVVSGIFWATLTVNRGVFTYVLDDPYISLALSDQIRHGQYGINTGVPAAPSSSILYPLLLAAGSGTPLHSYLPLIFNIIGLFFTLELSRRLLLHLKLSDDGFGTFVQAMWIVLMALCFNLAGVVFTGLEHSVHIALVAATIYGLVLFLDEDRLPLWLPAVIVLAPLVRYEGLALSIGSLVVLALRGRWRLAATTFATVALLVGGFSAFLLRLGLAPLPGSVLVKSNVAAAGVGAGSEVSFARLIWRNVEGMSHDRAGLLLLLVGVAAAIRCVRELGGTARGSWTPNALMSLLLVCLIAGHAAAGHFGWFYRYEDYVMLGAASIGVYLLRGTIRRALADKHSRLALVSGATISMVFIGDAYWHATMHVSQAAHDVYEQQLQMQRFVLDFYRGPVAVNDLGLVSYRNPDFVLDLGGLASQRARDLLQTSAGPEAYRALLKGSGVHLLIVYDDWFVDQFPADWLKVGSMDLSHPHPLSVSESEVQFYATDSATALKVRGQLEEFRKALPPGVRLTIYSAADSVPHSGAPCRPHSTGKAD
jgi:hypothetical protein